MIDLHCHILPGVDDGAQNLSESIDMAKKAVEQGIHTIVATPHHLNNRYENPKNKVMERVEQLNQALIKEKIDLNILPGQEIRIYGELIQGFDAGEILAVDNTQYVLVEFPSNHVPRYTEKLFYEIQMNRHIPIIVHPERNLEIIEQPELLYRLVKGGALSQITANSVAGEFGKKIKNFSLQLVEHQLTHFIASDAHNTGYRTFRMREAFEVIREKYGQEMAYVLEENASLVVEGNHIYKEAPEPIKKKRFFGIF